MLSWEILWPVGTVILAGLLVYGLVKYYTRNKANDRITEQATREQYEHPRGYDEGRREALKARVRPD
jgi:hypothetical protein